MRGVFFMCLAVVVMVGCAGFSSDPITSSVSQTGGLEGALTAQSGVSTAGPYRLWGEWTFFINETHDRVDVVPRRQGRFHLNALKFLEDYCKNCLEITKIKNNGMGQ